MLHVASCKTASTACHHNYAQNLHGSSGSPVVVQVAEQHARALVKICFGHKVCFESSEQGLTNRDPGSRGTP